jgi:formylglycine-generating enzyme required for sulfatase activity/serine/threonine protein kinase
MSERQIFEHALELTDPARREQFLSQACGADHELRQRIDALLTSHDELSRFLETPVVQQIQTPSDTSGEATVQLPPRESAAHGDDSDSAQSTDLSFLMPSTKPGSIGVLGHYEILQVLGQGAFGIVFKAFDEKLQRHVAIKTMNVQMAATSPPRKRFLREARAAAAIRHDNVTQVYSVEEEPIPYLVMEYIDGITLHTKLNSVGPLDIPEMLHLGKQIAFGLAAAHEKGLVHRDIKPGNILLEKGAEQKVKITDFGLARAADDASLTQSGLIAGTPLYMAPEQALGQALDARTDLFSFGSVLYQMAAGHPPFRAPTTVAVLRRVVDDTQRPLREIIPEIPDWFVSIVNKLLAKNPDDRYQSAKEVADLLARCQSELQLTGAVTCVSPQRAGSVSARSTPAETVITDRSRIRQNSAESSPDGRSLTTSATKPFRKAVLYSLLLGVLVISPILFGKQISEFISPLIWGTIPKLPVVERAAGLRFDGKDDFIQIPVPWETPLLTIEAFVTPDESAPGGTLLQVSNEKRADAESIEMFDEPNESQKPQSFVRVMGEPSQGTLAAPLDRTVRQHRAITLDDQYLHYYVNGMWQAKRRVHPQDQQLWKLRQLTIGCKEDRTNFFTGVIDQLRISKVVRYKTNFAPVTSVSSDDSTLALYNFDEGTGETLKDSSGNGNDGRIIGPTWVHPARGLQFDGVDDYVDFENLAWSSNQYTFETWITPLAEHGTLFQIAVPEGNLHAYLYSGGSGTGMNRDQPYFNINGPRQGMKRQHLATVFDGQNLNFFIDGKLVGARTNVTSLTTPWTFQRLRIGGKLTPDASKPEFFHGRMEQFRVSKTARYVLPFTPGELKTDDETLALYDFTTGQGDVVKDVSGRSPDGKIVGATWVTPASGAASAPRDSTLANPSEGSRRPLAIAPFNAEQAKQHQTAWAEHLGIPAAFTDKHGTQYVLIPPGEFQMGFSQAELDTLTRELKQAGAGEYDLFSASTSGPQHPVRITKPFYMSTHEVTVAEYRKFIDETHYMTTAEQLGGQRKKWTEYLAPENPDTHPVLGVSWTDAETYCVLRSQQDGVTYRLPTEAEWEHACRAGTTTLWSFGDNPAQIGEYAVTAPAGASTQPVGSRKPNPLGLFDMYGNAEEWCLDWHTQDFYATCPTDDPVNLKTPTDANSGRVARGGGTVSLPWQLRSSTRRWDFPSTPVNLKGFRVVISGDLKKASEALDPKDPDRRAAEWVLSVGGVIIININGKEQRLGGGELPPGEFILSATEMAWHRVTDAGLVNFKDCKNLTALHLAQLPVTDAGLSYFKDCKDLRFLILDQIQASDAGLVQFKDCKEWKRIHLIGMPITDAGVAHFKVDMNLTDLTLDTLHVSDAGLAHFKDCKNLTDLKVHGAQLSDAGLAHFQGCKNLVNLDLVSTQMTDVGLAYFKDCKNLTVLDLDRTNLSDVGLEILVALPNLRTIRITRTKVTEAGVKKLSTALPGCKIEWDGGVIEPVIGWHGWPADAPPPAIAPFNAEQARQHQEAWAKYLNVPVEYTNSLGMKFRLIPPGEFLMGSTPVEIEASVQLSGNAPDYIEAARSEGPLRKVAITKPFYMGATEVTQRNYERIVSMNPSHFSPSGPGRQEMKDTDTADHPVDSVDWTNAIRFCDLLSSKDVLRPEPVNPNADTAQRYQLPTEAEWEFACRAGTETSYWCGDLGMKIDAVAWTSANSEARTHRVAQKLSNPFGLYDVYGNAFEWTADSWSRSIDVTGKSNVDPVFRTTEEKDKVLRGGCCFETWALCRSGRRFQLNSELTNTFIGFRVSLPVDAVRQALKLIGPAMPKPVATSPSAPANGEWIDVIPLIDPVADKLDIPQATGQNGWRKENNELVIPLDERGSKLLLPLDSAWSAFECELEFTRHAGSGGFNVNLPTQQGECSVVVDHPSGKGGVFLGARNKGVVLVEGPRIETGKRATLRIELRREQNADRVSVAIDGTTVGQWSGDRNEIGKESNEGYPIGRRLSLWIHEGGNEFVFHRVRVKMLDGETAKPLRLP